MSNPLDNPKVMYEVNLRIINSSFGECLELGWSKEAAASKTIYEIEPMVNSADIFKKKMVLFETCYFFAEQNVEKEFVQMFGQLIEKKGMGYYKGINELIEFKEELDRKEKVIINYASKHFYNNKRRKY